MFFRFVVQVECKLGHGGHLGYIHATSEMINFRKLCGASEAVFRKFSATEVVKGDYRAGSQSDCRKISHDRLSTNQIAVYLICIFKMAR